MRPSSCRTAPTLGRGLNPTTAAEGTKVAVGRCCGMAKRKGEEPWGHAAPKNAHHSKLSPAKKAAAKRAAKRAGRHYPNLIDNMRQAAKSTAAKKKTKKKTQSKRKSAKKR